MLLQFVKTRFRPTRLCSTADTARRLLLVAAAVCCSLAGCKSTVDDVNIKDVYGPAGRLAKNNLIDRAKRDVKGDPEFGQEEFNAAHKLYEEQNYVAARKALKKLLKKCKKKNAPIEEDTLFYLAECDYQLGRFPDAQDGYDELIKKFSSTRHLDQCSKRLYTIALYWLNAPKPASEIELASFTDEEGGAKLEHLPEAYDPGELRVKPNFTDKSRPFFDTPGRAMQALRTVWLHDASSPLAPKALMTQALYHLRKRDYREADQYFSQIRDSYHKPEHEQYVKTAYILGAHASLKSYLGARYDGKQLEEARKLTNSAIRLYPDCPQRPKLESDLRKIDAELIEREWQRALYYKKRSEKVSAAVHLEYLINTYPDSPQAAQARELLLEYGPEHSAGILEIPLVAPKKPAVPDTTEPAQQESADEEAAEPARLRVSDSDKDAKPISEAP